MSIERENERFKNTATWLSDISVALIAAGVVVPLLNQILKISTPLETDLLTALVCSCFCVSVVLHLVSLAVLRGIE